MTNTYLSDKNDNWMTEVNTYTQSIKTPFYILNPSAENGLFFKTIACVQ